MSFKRIGILSIGEMGYHWARVLGAHGVELSTVTGNRSETTRQRAESAGVQVLPSLEALVSHVDLVVSIVVPSASKQVATRVAGTIARCGKKGLLYLDANAISPMTAEELNRVLTKVRARYVDGCIIGSAAKMDQGAEVYVSGPDAPSLEELNLLGLSVKVLGSGSSQASALKVLHAGLTKGLAGLFLELLVGAEKFSLLSQTLDDYERSYPGLPRKVGQSMLSLPTHAARRSEEMTELGATFQHFGLEPIVVPAVGKILKSIATLKNVPASATQAKIDDPSELIKRFTEWGLLGQPTVQKKTRLKATPGPGKKRSRNSGRS